ncbi:MAG: hypothetical protein NW241_17745 [Bacteroidia bacterium]|nr:hypothetical protein [Bacteroidia bacterium]
MHYRTLFFLLLSPALLHAQIERVFDDNEQLIIVNPLGESGQLEGTGLQFYPSGGIAVETPYHEGKISGIQKQYYENGALKSVCPYLAGLREGLQTDYYPNGALRMRQQWKSGLREGEMQAFFPDSTLNLYALMAGDTVQFAQRFNETGDLVAEQIYTLTAPVDTAYLTAPAVVRYPDSLQALRPDQPNRVRVFIPKVPSTFLAYSSPDGTVDFASGDDPAVLLTPGSPESKTFELILLVRTRANGGTIRMQKRMLPVQP